MTLQNASTLDSIKEQNIVRSVIIYFPKTSTWPKSLKIMKLIKYYQKTIIQSHY